MVLACDASARQFEPSVGSAGSMLSQRGMTQGLIFVHPLTSRVAAPTTPVGFMAAADCMPARPPGNRPPAGELSDSERERGGQVGHAPGRLPASGESPDLRLAGSGDGGVSRRPTRIAASTSWT